MSTDTSRSVLADGKRTEFMSLFREFVSSFPSTPEGRKHIDSYEKDRERGRENFAEIVVADDLGEDVTEQVLLKLLPYSDTAGNWERGAWVHIAPAVQGNLRQWFEGIGWTQTEDWPNVAKAILRFVRRCEEYPSQLSEACQEFSESSYSKGFQAGLVTPILNALRPDHFLLINNKSRKTINYFAGTSHGQRLVDYPAINETGWRLIEETGEAMRHSELEGLRDADRFDMFSHWLVAIKEHRLKPPRFWKIAPGANAWQWDECREKGFIAIGWEDLGDVSGLSRAEFDKRRDEMVAKHRGWTKDGVNQVWTFSRIEEGDRVVANRGTDQVLGIGTVIGQYAFVPGARHAHRLPVRWDDLTPRRVKEGNWRRTLAKISPEKFEAIRNAPPLDAPIEPQAASGVSRPESPFSAKTFELLERLHAEPTRALYQAHKEAFKEHLEGPFQRLFRRIAAQLPPSISDLMQTESRIFARIPKNDYGRGGAWDFYWGAFYPKGGKRTTDAQLFMGIHRDRLEFGFYIGEYGSNQRTRFVDTCRQHSAELTRLLRESLSDEATVYGKEDTYPDHPAVAWDEWLKNPEEAGIDASVVLPRDEVLRSSEDDLVELGARTYERLFPLVLLATEDEPLPVIADYLGSAVDGPGPNPVYSLAQLSQETGFEETTLARWVRAIQRKGQAVVYGPPGTGKTYLAERLAKHLIDGDNGFSDIVQFHPSYAYEDFMQGIRPQTRDGALDYPLLPGRFLEFCREAKFRQGPCVLIIDEINRADLSRVFGELMYLLEYRDREIPLAGGQRFAIPPNVRIIGTMNTADRSIALVDYALRRRFAFLELYPDYGVLRRYHESTGFPVEGLIRALEMVNRQIGDRHYAVGVTFFLRENLRAEIEDVWRMEIEPYLEEYFFDRPEKADQLRWTKIEGTVFP